MLLQAMNHLQWWGDFVGNKAGDRHELLSGTTQVPWEEVMNSVPLVRVHIVPTACNQCSAGSSSDHRMLFAGIPWQLIHPRFFFVQLPHPIPHQHQSCVSWELFRDCGC